MSCILLSSVYGTKSKSKAIILGEKSVLENMKDVPQAACLLLGLMYMIFSYFKETSQRADVYAT